MPLAGIHAGSSQRAPQRPAITRMVLWPAPRYAALPERAPRTVIIRNPTGRTVRLEIVVPYDDATMTLEIGPRATVDLARYQSALDALTWAHGAPEPGQGEP